MHAVFMIKTTLKSVRYWISSPKELNFKKNLLMSCYNQICMM